MKAGKHIITMLVENEPGVTARVSGLFASRGYNIETICGAPTANPKNVTHHDIDSNQSRNARTNHETGSPTGQCD